MWFVAWQRQAPQELRVGNYSGLFFCPFFGQRAVRLGRRILHLWGNIRGDYLYSFSPIVVYRCSI